MQHRFDLTEDEWTLTGWRPYCWRLGKSMETGWGLKPDIETIPAELPGTVQQALLMADLIPDWNLGVESRSCEWAEHRHWDFSVELPADLPRGVPLFLEAAGLDYSGWVLLDGKEIGGFSGALKPHRFALPSLGEGETPQLSIVFDTPPEEQGQMGYTSLTLHFKPRYSFGWDWCPRLVPIGVTGDLEIITAEAAALDLASLHTSLDESFQIGAMEAVVTCDPKLLPAAGCSVRLELAHQGIVLNTVTAPLGAGRTPLVMEKVKVQPWWPNGMGKQNLYQVKCTVSRGDEVLAQFDRQVGFKHITWEANDGAPEGARPWICVVNGRPVFLQGVNWVPPRAFYPDSTPEDYERLITLYQEMGCNLLRVWGGAILESTTFYELCDSAGLMVWQEFPLSSSGIDNWPPEDPDAIAELVTIARGYIKQRAHHASLLMWCGGNELQGGLDGSKMGVGKPVDESHPCIAALAAVVAELDPEKRFVPTSSSGPRFTAEAKEFGLGVHHDIHGPWGLGGLKDLDEWNEYWQHDDALMRSETGFPSASALSIFETYGDVMEDWPPNTEYWMHSSAWWTQWDRLRPQLEHLNPSAGLQHYVELTQREQADALAAAARACKARFPRCGGFLVWMGHDCFPCPANTAIIDFDAQPKPAYFALQLIFKADPGAL